MTDPSFSTTLPIVIYIRPQINPPPDWQVFERGPGFFDLPVDHELGIRVHGLNDDSLKILVNEVKELPHLIYLNLSENRRISNEGLEALKALRDLQILNLSSVDLSNQGLSQLLVLIHLRHLDLSYCNRITDTGLKHLRALPDLTYLNLQGCVKITNGGIARFNKRGLTIHK